VIFHQVVETYVHLGFSRSAQVATSVDRMQPVQSLLRTRRNWS
jgi:hypothetical protein